MKRTKAPDPNQVSFLPAVEEVKARPKRGRKSKDWSNQAEHGGENGVRLVESQVNFEEGPLFRAKRMALGLTVGDLVSGREKVRLLIDEDGRRSGQWYRYWPILQQRFEQRVRDHVAAGLDLWDLRLNPWTMAEIMKVVR